MKAPLRTILALLVPVLSASCSSNPADPIALAQCDAQYRADSLRKACYKKAWHDANYVTVGGGSPNYYGGAAALSNTLLNPPGPQYPQLVIPQGNGYLITR